MVARQHHLIGPVMEQPQYNMLVRQKVEVDYAKIYSTVGLGTTIWSPLASGILSGKYNDGFPTDTRLNIEGLDWLKDSLLVEENLNKVRKITALAKEWSVSPAVLAISWCLKNPNVSTVILGASKASQLQENFKALEFYHRLSDAMMLQIEAILQNKPKAPEY